MKAVLLMALFGILTKVAIFDFNQNSESSSWKVVDDRVMGGVSQGYFSINEQGNGIFKGRVSLDNYGGFSSIRHQLDPIPSKNKQFITLKVKGDGKRYQFRIKSNSYYSYLQYFETSNDWQILRLPLENFYPAFRGRKLPMPNFSEQAISEVSILIGNKKAESFALEIDFIILE